MENFSSLNKIYSLGHVPRLYLRLQCSFKVSSLPRIDYTLSLVSFYSESYSVGRDRAYVVFASVRARCCETSEQEYFDSKSSRYMCGIVVMQGRKCWNLFSHILSLPRTFRDTSCPSRPSQLTLLMEVAALFRLELSIMGKKQHIWMPLIC